jgi:hypothetical protein
VTAIIITFRAAMTVTAHNMNPSSCTAYETLPHKLYNSL